MTLVVTTPAQQLLERQPQGTGAGTGKPADDPQFHEEGREQRIVGSGSGGGSRCRLTGRPRAWSWRGL
jgi:hypothetical protein